MNVLSSIPENTCGIFNANETAQICNIFFQGWNKIGAKPLDQLVENDSEFSSKAYNILDDLLTHIFNNKKTDLFIVFVKEYDDPYYRDLYRLYYASL